MKLGQWPLIEEMTATLTETCDLIRRVVASRANPAADRQHQSKIQSALEDAAVGMMAHLAANSHEMHKALVLSASPRMLEHLPKTPIKGIMIKGPMWEKLVAVVEPEYVLDAHERGANYGMSFHPLLRRATEAPEWDRMLHSEAYLQQITFSGYLNKEVNATFGTPMAAPMARLIRALKADSERGYGLSSNMADALKEGRIETARLLFLAGVEPAEWLKVEALQPREREFVGQIGSNHGRMHLQASLGSLEDFLRRSHEEATA